MTTSAMSLRRATAAALIALLASAAGGCTAFEELRACGEVIDTMNPLLTEIRSEGEAKEPSPEFARLQASRYRAIADALSEVPHGPATLATRITTLTKEFRRVATLLDDAARAREESRLDRYLAARAGLEASQTRLLDLKRQLAHRCGQ